MASIVLRTSLLAAAPWKNIVCFLLSFNKCWQWFSWWWHQRAFPWGHKTVGWSPQTWSLPFLTAGPAVMDRMKVQTESLEEEMCWLRVFLGRCYILLLWFFQGKESNVWRHFKSDLNLGPDLNYVLYFLIWAKSTLSIWHYVRSCDESFPEALQKIWRPTGSTLAGGG